MSFYISSDVYDLHKDIYIHPMTSFFVKFHSGMDLIIDGWFHERGELWPGQAMSLQVKNVLYHGRSKFQDVLVFVSLKCENCEN